MKTLAITIEEIPAWNFDDWGTLSVVCRLWQQPGILFLYGREKEQA